MPTSHGQRLFAAVIASLPIVALGCGGDDGGAVTPTTPARVVEVTMSDNRFDPASIDLAAGETVEFRFSNAGTVAHDAFIGDSAAQAAHAVEMAADDGHGHGGRDEAVTVEPGEDASLRFTFDAAGPVEIGCHQPGHYAAGMKVALNVT